MGLEKYDISREVESRFSAFKREFTFEDIQEALSAMQSFLAELEEDEQIYSEVFKAFLRDRCLEAFAAAEKEVNQPPLKDNEVYEWRIDPVGAALERRAYVLGEYVLEDWEDDLPRDIFQADYDTVYIGISEDMDNVTMEEFVESLELSLMKAKELLHSMPNYAYTGTPNNPDELRISRGAMLFCVGVKEGECPRFWPRPTLTRKGANLI